MIDLNITVNDHATPALKEKLAKCDSHSAATKIVVPITRHIRDNFLKLPKNKSNFPSTGFWEAAARSTVGVAVGGNCLITVDKLGVRQRLYGGPIAARNAKYITIPICAEAYGTAAADWGDQLVLVVLGDGRKFLALWLGWEGGTDASETSKQRKSSYDKLLGKLTKRAETTVSRIRKFSATAGADQSKPDVLFFKGGGGGAARSATIAKIARHANLKFLFVLKESVMQAGNPLVIPQDLQEFSIQQVNEATE